MAIESAPYWFARCDACGNRGEYDGFSAFEDAGHAADMALSAEWTEKDGVWHCPDCPPLGTDDDEWPTRAELR